MILGEPPQRVSWATAPAPERAFRDWRELEKYTDRLQRVNECLARDDAQGRRERYLAVLRQGSQFKLEMKGGEAQQLAEELRLQGAREERQYKLSGRLRDLERQNFAHNQANLAQTRQREADEKAEEARRRTKQLADLSIEPREYALAALLRQQNADVLREQIEQRVIATKNLNFEVRQRDRVQVKEAVGGERAREEREQRETQARLQEHAQGLRTQLEDRRRSSLAPTAMTRFEADINHHLPVCMDHVRPTANVISGLPSFGMSHDRVRQLDVLDRNLRAEADRLAHSLAPVRPRAQPATRPCASFSPQQPFEQLSAYEAIRLRGSMSVFDVPVAAVKEF